MRYHYFDAHNRAKERELEEALRANVIAEKLAVGAQCLDEYAREKIIVDVVDECHKRGCRHPEVCAKRVVSEFDARLQSARILPTKPTIFMDAHRKKVFVPHIVDMKTTRENAARDAMHTYLDAPTCEQ